MIRTILMVCITLLVLPVVQASRIRTVNVNDKAMQSIYLKMGQATVLRFTDKPRKVVIGNQNYFSIEFIEKDLTIQPLSDFDTNLFVYTEYRTYGFQLKSCFGCKSDDLIYVKWKPNRYKPKKIKQTQIGYKAIGLVASIPKKLKFNIIKAGVSKSHGLRYLDLQIKNISQKNLNISTLNITATNRKKKLKRQSYVLEKEKLKKGEFTKARLFLPISHKKGFTLNINWEEQKINLIISGKYLR